MNTEHRKTKKNKPRPASDKKAVQKAKTQWRNLSVPQEKKPDCKPYPPKSDKYMSVEQLAWFYRKLLDIRELYQRESVRTAQDLRFQEKSFADDIDRANSEFGYVVDLRENERLGNLQHKIDNVLHMIRSNQYGYCTECEEQIGLERMVARPVATLCIDCKQYYERLEKQSGS